MRYGNVYSANRTLRLLGAGVTSSNVEPSSKSTGDLWFERGAGGDQLYAWPWWWDNTYWRSPDLYLEVTLLNAMSRTWGYMPMMNSLNVYLRTLRVVSFPTLTQSGSNYWLISVNRRNIANTTTIINSINTASNVLNNWNHQSLNLNTHVTCGTNFTMLFDVDFNPVNAAGGLYAGAKLVYNLVRP